MIDHLSFSQWKSIATCPAAWHAEKVAKVYKRESTEAMALGTLLHAAVLQPMEVAVTLERQRDFLLTAKGKPTSKAQRVLDAAVFTRSINDVATYLLDDSEVEVTERFDMGGMTWECRLDIFDRKTPIVADLKNVKDIAEYVWTPGGRRHWTEAALYWWQLALYRACVQHAIGRTAMVAILAVEPCEGTPDVRVLVPHEADADLLTEYAAIMASSVEYGWASPVTGQALPPIRSMAEAADSNDLPRCESCEWCRSSRKTAFFTHAIRRDKGL